MTKAQRTNFPGDASGRWLRYVCGMPDTIEAFKARYHDLAVVTCEWRAFGVEDPEVMATGVFRKLQTLPAPPDLKRFYKCVEFIVDMAYRTASGKKSLTETIFSGQWTMIRRGPEMPDYRIRQALAGLPMREADVLRQAFWDELTPAEMAEVNGHDAPTQQSRLDAALAHFASRLPAPESADPEAAMRGLHPGEHRRYPAE